MYPQTLLHFDHETETFLKRLVNCRRPRSPLKVVGVL